MGFRTGSQGGLGNERDGPGKSRFRRALPTCASGQNSLPQTGCGRRGRCGDTVLCDLRRFVDCCDRNRQADGGMMRALSYRRVRCIPVRALKRKSSAHRARGRTGVSHNAVVRVDGSDAELYGNGLRIMNPMSSNTGLATIASSQSGEINASRPRPEGRTVNTFAVEAVQAARLCGVSRATWYSLRKAGRIPRPVRLGRRVLWRIDELREWMAAGCPPCSRWDAMKKGRWN